MRKLSLLFIVFLAFNAGAQNVNYTGIKRVYLQGIKAFTENNEVKGYSCFYFLDKANRKENLYALNILDENLKQTHYVELTKSKDLRLLESSYNGERFCYSFLNSSKKTIEYILFDKEGKEAGDYKIEKLNKTEISYIERAVQSEDNAFSGGLASIPGKGFIRYGWEKENGIRMELEMFDNSGQKVWSATSGSTAKKSYEAAYPYYSDDKVIASLFITREGYLSQKFEHFLTFHDAGTGKELFRLGKTSGKYIVWPNGVSYDENSNLYYVYGEYFKAGDNPLKDKSIGLYFQAVDITGKVQQEGFNSWIGDIGRVVSVSDKGKFADNMSICIQKIVRTADGKTFAIGEQFKRTASALGIASTILNGGGGGSSVTKIDLHDMMVFEFDKNFRIIKSTTFQKDKTSIELPWGFDFYGNSFVAYALKSWGRFDYEFTTISSDKKTFSSAYVNYDKDKEEGNSFLIGDIAYTKEGKLAFDKIKLKDKPTMFAALPAKPGYMAVFKYFKKTKEIDFTLEKMNL